MTASLFDLPEFEPLPGMESFAPAPSPPAKTRRRRSIVPVTSGRSPTTNPVLWTRLLRRPIPMPRHRMRTPSRSCIPRTGRSA